MRNYFLLTVTLFKCGYGGAGEATAAGKGRRKIFRGPLLLVFILLCMMPVIASVFSVTAAEYTTFAAYGIQHVLIEEATVLGAVMTLIFGLPTILSVFYTSSDLPVLLALPLSADVIVAAKWTVCLVYEYLMVIMMVVPLLAGYGYASGAGAVYWLTMVCVCILLPVLPLIYAAVFSMLFMRIFRFIRNKQALTTIGFVFTMIMAVGISMFSQNLYSMQALQNAAGSMAGIKKFFPNLILADLALEQNSLLYLLFFVLSLAAAFFIFLLLARAAYFKGAVGMTEANAKRHRLSGEEKERFARTGSAMSSYIKVEMLKVVRSPAYFMNCVLMDLIWPLFFILPMVFSAFGASSGEEHADFSFLRFLTAFASRESSLAVVLLVVIGLGFLAGSMNLMTASTISREGRGFYFIKCIPMPYEDQMRAKILSGIPFSLIGTLFYSLILTAFAVAHGMMPLVFLYEILLVLPILAVTNYIQLFFDLAFPKLVWENEMVPVKQNLHSLAAVGVCVAFGAAVVLLGVLLFFFLHAGVHVTVLVLLLLLCGIAAALRFLVFAYAKKRIAELE